MLGPFSVSSFLAFILAYAIGFVSIVEFITEPSMQIGVFLHLVSHSGGENAVNSLLPLSAKKTISIAFICLMMIIGLRFYLYAWAIETSNKLKKAVGQAQKPKLDIPLRTIWILACLLTPIFITNFNFFGKDTSFKILLWLNFLLWMSSAAWGLIFTRCFVSEEKKVVVTVVLVAADFGAAMVTGLLLGFCHYVVYFEILPPIWFAYSFLASIILAASFASLQIGFFGIPAVSEGRKSTGS